MMTLFNLNVKNILTLINKWWEFRRNFSWFATLPISQKLILNLLTLCEKKKNSNQSKFGFFRWLQINISWIILHKGPSNTLNKMTHGLTKKVWGKIRLNRKEKKRKCRPSFSLQLLSCHVITWVLIESIRALDLSFRIIF